MDWISALSLTAIIIVSSSNSLTWSFRRRTSCIGKRSSALGVATTTSTEVSAFENLAKNITDCLYESDKKRDDSIDGASTGWTGWVDEASSKRLKSCLDSLCLSPSIYDDDQSFKWVQFFQSAPAPMVVELSTEIRDTIRQQVDDSSEGEIRDLVGRVGCRLIVLPSGSSLSRNLQSPPGSMVFGTLLQGGVTRYRLIGSSSSGKPKRRAGERRLIRGAVNKGTNTPQATSFGWLQYGGPKRNYQAVDMGPCLLMEMILLPKGLRLELLSESEFDTGEHDMVVSDIDWNPHQFLISTDTQPAIAINNETTTTTTTTRSQPLGSDASLFYLESSFCTTIGGLRPQIDEIVRRIMDGRVVRPLSSADDDDGASMMDHIRREEMKGLLELGLEPVRGVLLYGSPGCGKTALAREISTILDARPPKIVAAPELLDRWVGGSERLIRELFADAEQELKACGGDPTKSALHVVVIDEIDAVFRKRTTAEASGEVTRASAVNQILSKLDGINSLDNVLLIGMTNRKELLDPALLRPGRLEVHIEIGLPDREGRREILLIHFNALRKNGRLSLPLCDAIDGVNSSTIQEDAASNQPARLMSRIVFPWRRRSFLSSTREYHVINDLADDRWTGGFSGADIAGLVRCAGSIALARSRNQGDGGLEGLLVTLEDVYQALEEVKQ